MHRFPLRAAVALVCIVAVTGCGKKRRPRDSYDNSGYGAPAYGAAPMASPVANANWNGIWQTSFGRLAMEHQSDGTVIGVYKYNNAGREIVGALKGGPDGGALHFRWAESEGGAGNGRGAFYMNANGGGFTGTWGTGESDTSGGRWDGKRE